MLTYEFIARGYTDGLSRVPAPQELVAAYQSNAAPCSREAALRWVNTVLLGAEFMVQPLKPSERVQVAYRFMLNRDPEPAGWQYYNALPWTRTVNEIGRSPEFAALVNRVCRSPKGHGFGVTPLGDAVPDTELRAQLAAAQPGSVVNFSGRVAVTSPLRVPPGVILQGGLTPGHYATLGHLLRAGNYPAPIVEVQGTLQNAVVDGRFTDTQYVAMATNIEITESNAVVQSVRSQNSAGWTALFCSPHHGVIHHAQIRGNTIIGNAHQRRLLNGVPQWSDGISAACDSATISNNTVVNATDVAFISFDPSNRQTQHTFTGNYVLNSGNDSWGLFGYDQQSAIFKDWSATTFSGTLVYTAPPIVTRVAVLLGASAWGGERGLTKPPQVVGNYGYANVELYGVLADTLYPVPQQQITFNRIRVKVNPPCQYAELAQAPTNTYNCLFTIPGS
jgi:hypothetical protein